LQKNPGLPTDTGELGRAKVIGFYHYLQQFFIIINCDYKTYQGRKPWTVNKLKNETINT